MSRVIIIIDLHLFLPYNRNMNKIHIPCDVNEIPKAIDQLKERLIKKKTDKKEMMRTLLMTEDVLTQLIENSSEKITLSI